MCCSYPVSYTHLVTVDANSSLRLTGNKNNSVNVGSGKFESAGTFVGNVVVNLSLIHI